MIPKGGELVLEPMSVTRVVSTSEALDDAGFSGDSIVLRTAPDEVLVLPPQHVEVDDAHAVIVEDSGWYGGWVPCAVAEVFLRNNCTWELPTARPSFAQGRVADAPVKLWLESERVLFLVPHVAAHDLMRRMAA